MSLMFINERRLITDLEVEQAVHQRVHAGYVKRQTMSRETVERSVNTIIEGGHKYQDCFTMPEYKDKKHTLYKTPDRAYLWYEEVVSQAEPLVHRGSMKSPSRSPSSERSPARNVNKANKVSSNRAYAVSNCPHKKLQILKQGLPLIL